MDAASERRYSQLKRKLEVMKYIQPLGMDSVLLVEKLVSDLTATIEAHRQLSTKLDATEKELQMKQNQMQPLIKENSRLIRENNGLHARIVKDTEDFQENSRGLNVSFPFAPLPFDFLLLLE